MDMCLKLLIVLTSASPLVVHAQAADSVRENCRRAVSGTYLSVYDRMVYSKNFALGLDKELTKYRKALQEKSKKLAEKKRLVDSKDYDASLARERDSAQAAVDNVEAQIEQVEQLKAKANLDIKTQTQMVEKLEKKIKKVFKIVHIKAESNNTYPFRIEFLTECAKYRYSCPLPRQQAFDLIKILENAPEGESCRNYASSSGVDVD